MPYPLSLCFSTHPPPDSTPDAIHNISRSVHVASRQALKPKTFSSSIPVRATPSASGAGGSSAAMTIDTSLVYTPTASSLIYTPGVVRAASTQNDEMTGPVRPATSTKRSRKGVVDKGIKGIKGTKVVPKGTGTSSSRGKVLEWVPKGEPDEVQLYSPLPNTSSASCSKESDRTLLPCPINATDMDNAVASEANRLDHSKLLKPHDLLADQVELCALVVPATLQTLFIADCYRGCHGHCSRPVSFNSQSDRGQAACYVVVIFLVLVCPSSTAAAFLYRSFISTRQGYHCYEWSYNHECPLTGTEAFVSKDKVPRTPCTKSKMQQPCSDLDHTPLLAADSGKAPEGMPQVDITFNPSPSTKVGGGAMPLQRISPDYEYSFLFIGMYSMTKIFQ